VGLLAPVALVLGLTLRRISRRNRERLAAK
jgi:hypothetical protein